MKIVCVGGGPGALYFSILMRLQGDHDVTVIERTPGGAKRGWGVTFSDRLLGEMRERDPVTAAEVSRDAYEWRGQYVVVRGTTVPVRVGRGYSFARQKLIDILTERAAALGVTLESGREADASSLASEADLVVASEGATSRFRQAHAEELGAETDIGYSKHVWLGTDKVFESFIYAFVESEAGWLVLYAHAYTDDHSTFIVECSPDTWRGLHLDTLGVEASLELLQRLFSSYLEGHPLMVAPGEDALPWRNYRTLRTRSWHLGNIALMGDAAHTTHFSIGSGTTLALEDAIGLASALREHDVPTALATYERERRAALLIPAREARYSARFFDNAPRYIHLEPEQVATLLRSRRSPLLARTPPAAFYRFRKLLDDSTLLRQAYTKLSVLSRRLYVRRHNR